MSVDYTNMGQNANVKVRKFTQGQFSLLTKSMIAAGIGFILIGLIGFAIAYPVIQTAHNKPNAFINWINGLWAFSVIFILVAMVMSMFMQNKLFTGKHGMIIATWIIYILAEAAGFGILIPCFYIQFANQSSGLTGIAYLLLIFAAGGICFVISSLIGRKMSLKATESLGKFIGVMSIGFMFVFFIGMIATLIIGLTSTGGFMGDGLYIFLISLSTILFLAYMAFDMSLISKTSQFSQIDDNKVMFNFVLIFGFRLLVDLVGLVWNIAILVLRFSR